MFNWLTFDSLKASMGDWLGVLAIPVAFIIALLVVLKLIDFVVGLVQARREKQGQQP